MEKIVGKTRATDKCSAHAVKHRVVIEIPDSFQPTDVTWLFTIGKKIGMHRVQRMLQQGHARKL